MNSTLTHEGRPLRVAPTYPVGPLSPSRPTSWSSATTSRRVSLVGRPSTSLGGTSIRVRSIRPWEKSAMPSSVAAWMPTT